LSDTKRIGELHDLITITRGVPTQATAASSELPVFSVAELSGNSSTKRFIDKSTLTEAGLRIPTAGDTLISLEGATAGETFTVPVESDQFAASQQAAVVHVLDPAKLDPWYLGAWLTTDAAQGQLRRLGRGTGVRRIAIKDLSTLTMPMPMLPKQQRRIGQDFRTFQAAIKIHRDIADHLETMRVLRAELSFCSD
jgi:restriction endonuclease S subunit